MEIFVTDGTFHSAHLIDTLKKVYDDTTSKTHEGAVTDIIGYCPKGTLRCCHKNTLQCCQKDTLRCCHKLKTR